MKKTYLYSQGFTLLELLVTISIIGILIAIGSVSFSTAQKRGRDSRRRADLKAIQKSLEQCYSLSSTYPISLAGVGSAITCSSETTMRAVPADPKSSTQAYIKVGTWGVGYQLCADLEDDGSWTGAEQDICVYNQQ
ncbi:MAG: prepilin-type N-terminal cleavage/methylation domain-containing protein [Patescibacteria group bacterium]|nr:prepilin-type N-terminal cleavage/methylation domain-containing protein [Patescibacteria group bacterium]